VTSMYNYSSSGVKLDSPDKVGMGEKELGETLK